MSKGYVVDPRQKVTKAKAPAQFHIDRTTSVRPVAGKSYVGNTKPARAAGSHAHSGTGRAIAGKSYRGNTPKAKASK